jgi:hypothetical protein
MKLKRFGFAAAALSTAAIALPVSHANAATPPALAYPASAWHGLPAGGLGLPAGGLGLPAGRLGLPAGGLGLPAAGLGLPSAGLAFTGPTVGQVAAVIGPTIITTAPSTFINTNNQVSAGGALNGGQAAGPTTATG